MFLQAISGRLFLNPGACGSGILSLTMALLFSLGQVADAQEVLLFDFNSNTPFAGPANGSAGVGTQMSVTGTATTVTMTTVDIQAPVYVDDGNGGLVWNNTYATAGTEIYSSQGVAVDNLGASPFANEHRTFNPREYWEFTFDTTILLSAVRFNSLNNNDSMELRVGQNATPTVFTDGNTPGDYATMPLGSRIIEAGTVFRFTAGTDPGNSVAVNEIEIWAIGDIIESVTTGSADVGTTWDSGQPLEAGRVYRIVDGHEVTFGTGFPGFGLFVQNGTAEFTTNALNVPMLEVHSAGALNFSATGDVYLGDINSLPPMTLNGALNFTASPGASLFLDVDITGNGELNFEGNGAGSDLYLSAAEGWGGIFRFGGTGDSVRITETEGLTGILEMNSTGANTLVYDGGQSGGQAIFNQPGTLQYTSNTNRLNARLTINADVTVEMLDIANGTSKRSIFMNSSMRGSGDTLVIGTPSDPTNISAGITLNEFESAGSTGPLNAAQRHGSYSGTITTQDFVDVELRHSYLRAAVVISANGRLDVGRLFSSGDPENLTRPETISLGDVTIKSGGRLTVGYEDLPNGSTSFSDAYIQPNRLRLTAQGDRMGSLSLEEGSTTRIPLIGLLAGFDFGTIVAEGDVHLGGELQVVINPRQWDNNPREDLVYTATIGDTFDIITTAISVPDGDYNRDGVVNTSDYNLWKSTFGNLDNHSADGNNDGEVNLADYTVWRDNLGATGTLSGVIDGQFDNLTIVDETGVLAAAGATMVINYVSPNLVQLEVVAVGSFAAGTQVVPEPSSIAWVGLILAGYLIRRRRVVE